MLLDERLLQLALTGLTNGAIYALLGLGLVLVFGTTRIINVAIGEFTTFGALTTISLHRAGLPLALAAALAVTATALLAASVYRVTLQPARERGASPLTLLIITVALHLVLKGIALILWGTHPYMLPPFTPGPPLSLGGAVVARQSLWVLGVVAATLALLWWSFTRTVPGRALRACAVNPVGACLCGIPVQRLGLVAFSLSAALAAAGGVLIAPLTMATYDMGFMLGLKGFIGAVIGGLVNYPATVAGCLLLAVFEALAAGTVFPSGYRDALAFAALIAVLLARALPALRSGVLMSEEVARE